MEIIDSILNEYRLHLKNDFLAYRNHAIRIYNYCRYLDKDPMASEKYAIASAYHDLGIWVNNTFDYLGPSMTLAEKYLMSEGKDQLIEEVNLLICWHHKIRSYRGRFSHSVEVFRKSDLIDLSFGFLQFGIDKKFIRYQFKNTPVMGFHKLLLKVLLNHLRKAPRKPLPMFKW